MRAWVLVAASCGPPASAPTVPPPVVVETLEPAPAVRGSPGCGKVPGDVMDGRIVVDALDRTFVIDVPSSYDPRQPLPIAYGFHGNWDSGAGARKGYRLAQQWGEPMIAIYPDGLREAPDKPTTWAFDAGSRDFAFFDALHKVVLAQLCVDLDRVFVFGYSSGGFMASAIACTHGEMVRGVGAISAGLNAKSCAEPVAAFLAHGASDPIVPLHLGLQGRATWTKANRCKGKGEPTRDADGCERFACEQPVVWCTHPGPHKLLPDGPGDAVEFFRSLDD